MRSLVLLCLALSQVSGVAQPPPRDTPPPGTGTGAISGIVSAADTGLPLRRATVTLSSVGPGTGAATSRSVATDVSGRFVFTGLRAGAYRLRAMPGSFRGQYLASAYGGTRPTDAGERLTLNDAQQIEDVHIPLPRGGAITGRVVDDFGEPMARYHVVALRSGEFGMSGELPPEFFEELIKLGTEVFIGEGETRTLDLRLANRGGR